MAVVALPDWLDFRPRLFPSCNFAWLRGPRPVLVDSGFGTDLEATLALLPDEPALVFNTAAFWSRPMGGRPDHLDRAAQPCRVVGAAPEVSRDGSCTFSRTIVQDSRYRELLRSDA